MKRSSIWKFILCLTLASCTNFINTIDEGEYNVTGIKKDSFSIVFSHNINGETHPCGCRHHPLGGLPQVAGVLHDIQKNSDTLYIDSGDTFFASSSIPETLQKSLTFTAQNLAKGLGQLGLTYQLPGEQDLAMGWDFLKQLQEENKFTYLVSNATSSFPLKHEKLAILTKGPHRIFIIGLSDPSIFPGKFKGAFENPFLAINKIREELKKVGYKKDSPFHRLIAMTNSGIDVDTQIAKKFKELDWIIGSHSQSFTKFPVEEGKTKMVQVLSRNHYIGEIKIALKSDKSKDSFNIHETRDETAKLLSPNPYHEFLTKHKEQLSKIQVEEQNAMTVASFGVQKFNTANSCLECHQAQADHWQKTPHSIAYLTLIKAKEENNLACIKCHSLGQNSPHGFAKASDMVVFEEKDETKLAKLKESYMKELKESFLDFSSVRKLPPKSIENLSKKWRELDKRKGVTHNFANVQCLNCHDKHLEHPFSTSEEEASPKAKYENMRNKCLNCHDPDQSPEWYQGTKLNENKFVDMMKKVGCPKN
ncbi:multiheme c-type cytochrome [Halobacteriovorax marinus]|uniref:multiheme c-type cytochrome n=1 Tax=Halobacteriovorax marinus TaxID=97084 RepID=UPI003A921E7C